MSDRLGSTQPNIKVKRARFGRSILFNALGLIILLVLAILGGYTNRELESANKTRTLS